MAAHAETHRHERGPRARRLRGSRGSFARVTRATHNRRASRLGDRLYVKTFGTNDPITPGERLEAIAAETGARLVFLEGDHNMYLWTPDAVLEEIRRAN